jgi:DNA-directed RNA polymerase specialized sigma24 family protein
VTLTADQQALATLHAPFAKTVARHLVRVPRDEEEFVSIAYLTLTECAQSFDPARGVKFSTWVALKIRFAIQSHQRLGPPGFRTRKAEAPTTTSISPIEDGRALLMRPADPPGQDLEQLEEAQAVLKGLNPADAEVVWRLVVVGETGPEVAEEMGLPNRRYAYTALIRARRVLIARAMNPGFEPTDGPTPDPGVKAHAVEPPPSLPGDPRDRHPSPPRSPLVGRLERLAVVGA